MMQLQQCNEWNGSFCLISPESEVDDQWNGNIIKEPSFQELSQEASMKVQHMQKQII